jgi:hypothetical protein
MTNLLNVQARDLTKRKEFKLLRDRDGNFFKEGARIVVFYDGVLVKEYTTDQEARMRWSDEPLDGFPLKDYEGVDARLR